MLENTGKYGQKAKNVNILTQCKEKDRIRKEQKKLRTKKWGGGGNTEKHAENKLLRIQHYENTRKYRKKRILVKMLAQYKDMDRKIHKITDEKMEKIQKITLRISY